MTNRIPVSASINMQQRDIEALKAWEREHDAVCSRSVFCSAHQPLGPLPEPK